MWPGGPLERDFETMVSKRVLRGRGRAVVLALALSLFTVPMAAAADAPQPTKGVAAFWAGIEGWFQDLVTTWFGSDKPTSAVFATESQCMAGANCPEETGGGPGGVATTDEGDNLDPDG